MDILLGLVCVGVLLVLLYLAAVAGLAVLGVVYILWPVLAGVVGGVALWRSDHDNLAVIVFLSSLVLEIIWFAWLDRDSSSPDGSSYTDPMEGKIRVYDQDGKVVGYQDKPKQ
jgi:hypothetical protein